MCDVLLRLFLVLMLTECLSSLQLPDLPVALRQAVGLGGPGDAVGEVTVDRNARNRFKSRLQAKGMSTLSPLSSPRHHGVHNGGLGEINRRISDLKVEGGGGAPCSQSIMDLHARLAPPGTTTATPGTTLGTTLADIRRDSNSTVSTYYGSMRSADLGSSRRSSGVSATSNYRRSNLCELSQQKLNFALFCSTGVWRLLPSYPESRGGHAGLPVRPDLSGQLPPLLTAEHLCLRGHSPTWTTGPVFHLQPRSAGELRNNHTYEYPGWIKLKRKYQLAK